MSTVWIRVTYAAALALLLTLTVVFGIAMAATGPKPPQDPGFTFSQLQRNSDDQSARGQNQLVQQIDKYYGEANSFRADYTGYQRNVFLAASGIAVLLMLIGVGLPAVVNYLRLGFVASSALLFVYAFWMGTRSAPTVAPQVDSLLALLSLGASGPLQPLDFAGRFARFAVCFIGLILALFLGIWRLTEWRAPQRRVAASPPAQPGPAVMPMQPQPQPQPAMAAAMPAGASQWAPPLPPSPVAAPTPVMTVVQPPPPPATTVPDTQVYAYQPATPSPEGIGDLPTEPGPGEWRRPE